MMNCFRFDNMYACHDKSKLFRAWEDHYKRIGLSYKKTIKMVLQKVRKGKFPSTGGDK
jgi:hypothetical protein